MGRDIKRGQQGKANVYKNLYFNIRLRTSAFQKVSYFVHTIKTERKMTITLKKSPKIAKMKKSHFFLWAYDFTVGKKFILHFCTKITFIHMKKVLQCRPLTAIFKNVVCDERGMFFYYTVINRKLWKMKSTFRLQL